MLRVFNLNGASDSNISNGVFHIDTATDSYKVTYTALLAKIQGELSLSKSDVGLSNVDNTSDASKPVSIAQQVVLDLKSYIASFTPITVADAATRRTLAIYDPDGVVVGVTEVVQFDEPGVTYYLIAADVTMTSSWRKKIDAADGEDFIVSMELADVANIVPDPNVLGQVNGVPAIGDGVTTNGNQVAMRSELPFTMVGLTGGNVDVKYWTTVPNDSYLYGSAEWLFLGNLVTEIGSNAFSYTAINTTDPLVLPPYLVTVGADAFNGSVFGSIVFNERLVTIGASGFAIVGSTSWDCVLPASLRTVGSTGLGYSTFKSLTLNDGLLTMGGYALGNCAINIPQDLTLPDSLTSVGANCFDSTTGILDVYCNIAVGSFPSSALNSTGAGTLYVHSDFYAGYAGTHGSKTVAEWTSYPNPMP